MGATHDLQRWLARRRTRPARVTALPDVRSRTGNLYMLKSVSLDATTLEACVTYETVTGPVGVHWTRPAAEFFGPAVPDDATSPPRFRLVPSRFRTP